METSAGAIRAARAFVEIFVDDKAMKRGLAKSQRDLFAWGAAMQAAGNRMVVAGTAMMAPLVGSAAVFAASGHQLSVLSRQTGMHTDALQEMLAAAKRSDVGTEHFIGSVRNMQNALFSAEAGSMGVLRVLNMLGIKLEELRGLKPEEQFIRLADAIARIGDPTLRMGAARTFFGRNPQPVMPLIMRGAAGIEDLRQQKRDSGTMLTPEDIELAHRLKMATQAQVGASKHLAEVIGAVVAPAFLAVTEAATDGIRTASAWINKHRELVMAWLLGAAAVIGLGTAVVATGIAIKLAAVALGGFTVAWNMLVGAVAVGKAVILGLTAPIGLLTVGIAAMIGVLLVQSGAAGGAIDFIKAKIESLLPAVASVLDGVRAAFMAGDIGMAAKVLWLGIELAWKQGVVEIRKHWEDFKAWAMQQRQWIRSLLAESSSLLSGSGRALVGGMLMSAGELVGGDKGELLKHIGMRAIVRGGVEFAGGLGRAQSEAEAENAKTREERDRRNQALDADVDSTAEELRKAIEAAHEAEAAAQKRRDAERQDEQIPQNFDIEALLARLNAQTKPPQDMALGTFNARAIQSLLFTPQDDRIARATESTAETVKKLLDGFQFGDFGTGVAIT